MRTDMFKALLTAVSILSASIAVAEGTARDAQGMLSRLGYQISVDGSWGPKSQGVLGQFYTDRGLTYDGTLSENEFTDLSAAIAEMPYVHPRSPYVDYSKTYEFPSETWARVDDMQYYRERVFATYGMRFWQEGNTSPTDPKCQQEYQNFDVFRNLNLGNYDISKHPKSRDLTECLGSLVGTIHLDFLKNGKNSTLLRMFFEDLIPVWIANDAFNASGMRSTQDNEFGERGASAGYAFVIDGLAFIYTSYAKYYGTSPDLDQGFREWWDARSQDDEQKIYRPGWHLCKEFTLEQAFPKISGRDECNNVAADYSTALAYMGMYYKDSDYINEAMFVAGTVARTTSPEGATIDAWRYGYALGYTIMVTHKLDETALVLKGVGINLYDMSFASHGATVRDIIEWGAREYLNPDRIYLYACKHPQQLDGNATKNGLDCRTQNYSGVPPEDRLRYDTCSYRGMAGAMYQYPEFRDLMDNRTAIWNGICGNDTVFNKYILMEYFQ